MTHSLTERDLRYLEGLVRAGLQRNSWTVEDRQTLANKLIAIRVRQLQPRKDTRHDT